jgi:hypothetical protein
MENNDVPTAVDPWAASFDRLLDILNPLGVVRDQIADHYWIKRNIHQYRDLLDAFKYEEVLKLAEHIHPTLGRLRAPLVCG